MSAAVAARPSDPPPGGPRPGGSRPGDPRPGGGLLGTVERLADAALLGIAWLLACLPVVTWLPATAALVTAVGEVHTGATARPLRRFGSLLRATLGRGVLLGTAWLLLGAVVAASLRIATLMPGATGAVLAVGCAVVLAAWGSLGALLPVVLPQAGDAPDAVRRAGALARRLPAAAVGGLLLWLSAAGLVLLWPASVILVGGLAGYGVYLLCAADPRQGSGGGPGRDRGRSP